MWQSGGSSPTTQVIALLQARKSDPSAACPFAPEHPVRPEGTLARRASILVQFLLKYHVLPVITSVFALFPQFKRLPQKKSGRSYLFLENTPVRLTVPGCSLTFSFSKLYLERRSAEGNLPIFYVQFPSPARSSRYCRTHYGIRPLQLRESHFINSPCSSNA